MEGQLTDEQLRILKSKLEVLTRIHAEIGLLESKKHELLHNAVAAKTKLQDYQKELQEEYGDVSINIDDGTFSKPE
jgi:vacuolar-type H+-ATPase subunit D/Vma8